MKFWQLISIARENPESIQEAAKNPKWEKYLKWHDEFSMIVNDQDRAKLDEVLPEDFIKSVLENIPIHLFISHGYLRTRCLDEADEQISILNAYERFGGSYIDEVLEAGSVKVDETQKLMSKLFD